MKSDPKKSKSGAPERYYEGIGRRKTAVARVRVTSGKGQFIVNGAQVNSYFSLPRYQGIVVAPLEKLKIKDSFQIQARVSGGGLAAQAEAVRHGLARALTLLNGDFRKNLRHLGYLTRDPRMVERKKYGLKKARRAPQWAKR